MMKTQEWQYLHIHLGMDFPGNFEHPEYISLYILNNSFHDLNYSLIHFENYHHLHRERTYAIPNQILMSQGQCLVSGDVLRF